jgi:hypothetical protein
MEKNIQNSGKTKLVSDYQNSLSAIILKNDYSQAK